MVLPTRFKSNSGKEFNIKIMKINKRTFIIRLLGEKDKHGKPKRIKVGKRSKKLIV